MGRVAFEGFLLDADNALLWRGKERISLPPKPFHVLCHLVQRAGELVTKDELLDAVWPNLHVTESSLTVCINALRLALGDDSRSPRFVETVPRRGYRFIAPVMDVSNSEPTPGARLWVDANRAELRRRFWVGRESALAAMDCWFEEVAGGRRQLVFVTGEAGIGKTTFAEMLIQRVADRNVGVLIGKCVEHFGTDEAFLPLIEALSNGSRGPMRPLLLAALQEKAPAWLAQLPGFIDGNDRAALQSEVFGASRERMLREFCELLEALSQERPLILIIEDLHWSDYATLDVLSRFVHRVEKAAVLVIATYRPVDVMASGHPMRAVHQELQIHGLCSELSLNKLSQAEVEQYLALRLGTGEVRGQFAATVMRRTGGHPLFVVALVDYFASQGEIVEVDGCWRFARDDAAARQGIPRDLHEMIARQIDGLSPERQRLVEAASAAGAEFSAAAVAGAMDSDPADIDQACAEMARMGQILRADGIAEWPGGTAVGRYVFLHALYQEVLYERLAPGRRAVLHRQIGETLERGYAARTSEIAAVLALHFEEGRNFPKAVRYLAEAAENSTRRFANHEAANYLTRALAYVDRLPHDEERIDIRLQLLHQRGWARRSAGDLAGSLADIAATVSAAAEADRPHVEITGLLDLSRFCLYVDRGRCLELAEEALVKSRSLDDEILKALVQGNSSNLILLLKGWQSEEAELCRQALATTARSNDPRIALRRCSIASVLGFLTSDYRACCVATKFGQELAQEIGDLYLFAIYNMLEAFAYLHCGEWRALRESVTAALALSENNANREAAVLSRLTLGWLHAEALDFAGAKRLAEAALDPAAEKNPFNFFLGRNLMAKAALGLRDYDAAHAQFQQIKHKIEVEGVCMDTSFYPQYYFNLCEYWIEVGNLLRAQEQAETLKSHVAQTGERTYLALSHRALAQVAWLQGRLEDAGVEFDQAIGIVEASETALAGWRVHSSAAEFYAGVGDSEKAAASEARCRELIAALAAMFDEDDPRRISLLENYAAEARRSAPLNPAVRRYRGARLAGERLSRAGSGLTLHKP